MAKTIHIWLGGKTKDADGPAHAPAGSSKGGQFVSGSGGGGASRPKHTPMRQENRNLEAKQLKESKQIAKRPVSPGVNPSVRQMQAKSDVEQAKQRIAARKKPAAGGSDITKHPQYTKADHEYLKGKGWTDPQISERWDQEHKAGHAPQKVNKSNPPSAFTGMTGDTKK